MSNDLISQESFQLPDGGVVRTGCIPPSESDLLQIKKVYKVFGGNDLLDPKDIQRLLPTGFYQTRRKQRAHRMINQGNLGKCNASATVSAIHQVRALAGIEKVDSTKTPLADNHLYMNINGGRDQGSLLHKGFERLSGKGVCPRVLERNGQIWTFPEGTYNRSQVDQSWLRFADEVGVQYTAFEPWITPDNYADFVIAIASAVAREYPIVMAWHVGNDGMRLNNGYIRNANGPGNHATVIHSGKWVGGSELVHVDIMNSWGPSKNRIFGAMNQGWGDGGYGLMTMQSLFQCRRFHQYWVAVGTSEAKKEAIL